MSDLLIKAIKLAVDAHGTAINQDGTFYIMHPLRLMMQCDNDAERIVAILHDTLEDTYLKWEDLENSGFPEHVVEAVRVLTKNEGEEYDAYIARISWNKLATRIKLLDLHDNIDLTRLKSVGEYELQRAGKYHRAIRKLEGCS